MAVTQGLHVALAVTSVSIVAVYLPLTVAVVWRKPRAESTHWITAKLLMWVSQTMFFIPLWWAYAGGSIHPRSIPGLPDAWRVTYLTAELMAGTFFLAARGGMLWPRFFTWGGLMAAIVGWTTLPLTTAVPSATIPVPSAASVAPSRNGESAWP